MEIQKLIEQAAKETADMVIKTIDERGLAGRGKPENEKNAYQKTETLLYNYNEFKMAIKDKQAQIEDIRENGLFKGKSVVSANGAAPSPICEAESSEAIIAAIEKSITKTRVYVRILEDALDTIKGDPYFDIIRMRYFEGLSGEEIAFRLFVDTSTIHRNRRRLVDKLKFRLFSDEVIDELLYV